MTVVVERVGRDVGLDRWRGVAVVCMVVDHVALTCAVLGLSGPWDALRLTVGRVAFPVFLVVSGVLWARRGARPGRLGEIAAAGVFVSAVCYVVGLPIGRPDILLLIAAGLAVMPVLVRAPLVWLCVGVIQPWTWPVPWTGYQPGAVVVLLLVGWLVGTSGPLQLSALRACPAWVERVGRSALSVYVVHLCLLAAFFGGVVWVS